MAVQQNTDHIQTTHIGSLPRPHKLLDILKAKYGRQPYDEVELNSTLAQAVTDCVRKQIECGIEIVTDGEYSKPGFFTYIRERFDGFEARPNQKLILFQKEVSAFPDYYAQYFKDAMMGGAILPIVPVVCTGPVKYKGEDKLQIDIANVKAPPRPPRCPTIAFFCQPPRPRALALTSTTRTMKSISTRSLPSSTRNTGRSPPPAF
jgi:5-methyltetrahydropteroyltriglutamate--homocysteine methyltransferase